MHVTMDLQLTLVVLLAAFGLVAALIAIARRLPGDN